MFAVLTMSSITGCEETEDVNELTIEKINEAIQEARVYRDRPTARNASCDGSIGCYITPECYNPSGDYTTKTIYTFNTEEKYVAAHTISFEGSNTCDITDETTLILNSSGSVWEAELEQGTSNAGTLLLENIYYDDGYYFSTEPKPSVGDIVRIDFEKVGDTICLSEGAIRKGKHIKVTSDVPMGIDYQNCLVKF